MSRAILAIFVVLAATVAVPSPADELAPADKPIEEVVDHYIDAKFADAEVNPAEQADEANLMRRLMLDLAGRIPAAVEVREYLDSDDSDKRAKLIDRLMDSQEFADHMAGQFDTMLMADTDGSVRDYLKTAFQENRKWDRMFRELLLPKQSDETLKSAADFVKRRANDADKLTTDVSALFFGVNVSCAKCHDHPEVSDWSQDYFYGMKSFFNRTFENGGFIAERPFGLVKYTTTEGEERDARLMFLTGTVLDESEYKVPNPDEQKKIDERFKQLAKKKQAPPEPEYSRRARLVEIALKPDQNAVFGRAIVNRLWHQFVGYGLVMPLDQMHVENPPSHPRLLKWLARDLTSHNYDLRRLIRGLVLSKTYSRGSRWETAKRPRRSYFSVANLRPLTPLQYARSLSLATADPQKFQDDMPLEERQKRIAEAAGSGNSNQFEQPRENFRVTADEALFFSNSDQVVNSYLKGGLFQRLKSEADKKQMIEAAVWSIYSRAVTEEETKILSDYLLKRTDRQETACRQLIWALLTSTEFRFNY
ncbi:MAG: DUF1549 domain-containing protein [Planctomycetota bacterium]|nr:DUF1549 domain-containing protein [Planctomycetota bacterium]